MKKLLIIALIFTFLLMGCDGTDVTTTTPVGVPNEASNRVTVTNTIQWSDAVNHIGEKTTVCGSVIGVTYASSSNGKPTFINIGKNYPESGRFTALIWGENRSKFSPTPENQYKGKTVCVYGLIELYNGCAEIIVTSPSQITIQ